MSGTATSSGTGQLSGKVAIITGASRGVGAEIARVYAREGASVVVNYFNNPEAAARVVSSIEGAGGNAIARYGDVTSADDMEVLAEAAVAAFGRIDVLVNNALVGYHFDALSDRGSIKTVAWDDFEGQYRGTVGGAVNAVQAVLPYMESNGYGKIVNIGTNLVHYPVVTYYDHTTSKAALLGLTRNLAKELGPRGIRANVVAAGLLKMTSASVAPKELFDDVASATPLRRPTTVSDFAEACVYFAAGASDPVTGQTLSVDGGMTMP